MNNDLLLCPSCGGAPRLTRCGDQKEFVVYMCSACYKTPVRYDEARLTTWEAKLIWNRRASNG